MQFFWQLNLLSALYALELFIPNELMLNFYRIVRLTGWSPGRVNAATVAIAVACFTIGTTAAASLANKWLGGHKSAFWSAILWVPYFVLFTRVFATFLPLTSGGDAPNPAAGLLAIGAMLVFPLYILIVTFMTLGCTEKTINR